jgi:hypothetical protein
MRVLTFAYNDTYTPSIPEGSEAIMGRNVLQYLVVTLNGPAAVAEISI